MTDFRFQYKIRIINEQSETKKTYGITIPKSIVELFGLGTSCFMEVIESSGTKCILLKSGCSFEQLKKQNFDVGALKI